MYINEGLPISVEILDMQQRDINKALPISAEGYDLQRKKMCMQMECKLSLVRKEAVFYIGIFCCMLYLLCNLACICLEVLGYLPGRG